MRMYICRLEKDVILFSNKSEPVEQKVLWENTNKVFKILLK